MKMTFNYRIGKEKEIPYEVENVNDDIYQQFAIEFDIDVEKAEEIIDELDLFKKLGTRYYEEIKDNHAEGFCELYRDIEGGGYCE